MESDELATAIHLDENFLIIGDNKGIITILRRDGQILHVLNQIKQSNVNVEDEKLFSLSLNNRVNCIVRHGRHVWVGYENARAALYDLCKAQASPLATVQLQKSEAINSLVVFDGVAYCRISKIKKKKNSIKDLKVPRVLDIIAWSPPTKVAPELVSSPIGKELTLIEEKSTWYGKILNSSNMNAFYFGAYACLYSNNNVEIRDLDVI